jgi:pimeloyl-ACP methyl ester carboxylesterase
MENKEENTKTEVIASPPWFQWAMSQPSSSHIINVDSCPIHYLLWEASSRAYKQGGLLFVHGGGGHSHWWSFLAPFFSKHFKVAAVDLSGMGESGHRADYSAEIRSTELLKVIEDANLGENVFVIGHSFGGLTATKFAQMYGKSINGLILADSPIRPPEISSKRKVRRMGNKRHYPDYKTALGRFRLMPEQDCENDFLVQHIGHHSIKEEREGWTWKFDGKAMHNRRFTEPYHIYLKEIPCKTALVYGDESALLDIKTVDYMTSLMKKGSPVVGIPEAKHHLLLDQPMAFISVVRSILHQWNNELY